MTYLCCTLVCVDVANVSAVYGQHLEQTVSAYFYRLYGMFPCNFLVSLRTLCSQPDFVEVFTNVVMVIMSHFTYLLILLEFTVNLY